ncbi:hypothetical protein TWF970_006595 [Orbilia oligospora]|uniref:Uncharacterized protein n=1 Tax=Orbilia oligospora TaxID=2813651 RepID=A0A7C8RAT9_ORBOL|nr:hypothetical protein TWF970_006595 [Orbilia oligospora]
MSLCCLLREKTARGLNKKFEFVDFYGKDLSLSQGRKRLMFESLQGLLRRHGTLINSV